MSSRKKKVAEAHVRLYQHEMNCPAYRSLSTDARALLVEFRGLYYGRVNRVFMSVREIMKRINASQRRATAARDQLIEKGWIRVITPGTVSISGARKAAEYALTNEPDDPTRDGATATKDFMRWVPPTDGKKILVADSIPFSSGDEYYPDPHNPPNTPVSSCDDYYQDQKRKSLVAATTTQISYQGFPALGSDLELARLTVAAIFCALVIDTIQRGDLS